MEKEYIYFNNKKYLITRKQLAIYKEDDTYLMELSVEINDEGEGISLSYVEVPLFHSIGKLDAQIIHIDYDNNRFEDDTLGTDIESYGWSCETNHFSSSDDNNYRAYSYYEIKITFKKINDNIYEVNLELLVYDCTKIPEDISNDELIKCTCIITTEIMDEEPDNPLSLF